MTSLSSSSHPQRMEVLTLPYETLTTLSQGEAGVKGQSDNWGRGIVFVDYPFQHAGT